MQEGLPLTASPLMKLIVMSAFARAQHLFPVIVCHFIIMANHLHIIFVVENPDDIKDFIGRVKTEISHAVNRLLGRRQRSIWCESYDSPTLLTKEAAIDKIAYIYSNPQKASLVDTIEEYPGLSSWNAFQTGNTTEEVPWVRRFQIEQLSNRGASGQARMFNRIINRVQNKKKHTFTLQPDAWMNCFDIDGPEERASANASVIRQVRENEAEYREARRKKRQKCLGREALINQPIDKPYAPKSFGRRMWCICRDVALRVKFITFVKYLLAEAREVREAWRRGDTSRRYPLGLFPPSMPKLGNLAPPVLDTGWD